jgi:hypothetical protein
MKKYSRFSQFTALMGLSTSLCAASTQADTWTTPGSLQPKYKVEAVRFHCNDETGYDSPWFDPWISDEVKVGIATPGALTISRVFTDVDSGESRSFAPDESCILPIEGSRVNNTFVRPYTCSEAGTPGPFSFMVVMAEEDSGFFHECFSQFPPQCNFLNDNGPPDWNDELIGRRKVEFTAEELAAAMPNVGDTVEETITLGPCFDGRAGEGGCTTGTGIPDPAEYTFTYRLTRLPVQLQGRVLSDRAAQMAVPRSTSTK